MIDKTEGSGGGSIEQTISAATDRQIAFQGFLAGEQQRQAEGSAVADSETAAVREGKEGATGISERRVDDASDNNSIQTS